MHGKRLILGALALSMLVARASNQPSKIAGFWQTVDDKTHKPRGVVHIYEQHGEYFGRIVSCFDPKEAREKCVACPGALRNKPIIGLEFLRSMRENGEEYSGGTIIDPESGESYRCKITLEDNGRKLRVRGYVGLTAFGRTQVWTRYTPPRAMRETGAK